MMCTIGINAGQVQIADFEIYWYAYAFYVRTTGNIYNIEIFTSDVIN